MYTKLQRPKKKLAYSIVVPYHIQSSPIKFPATYKNSANLYPSDFFKPQLRIHTPKIMKSSKKLNYLITLKSKSQKLSQSKKHKKSKSKQKQINKKQKSLQSRQRQKNLQTDEDKKVIQRKKNQLNFNQNFQEELVQKQLLQKFRILPKKASNIQNLRSQNQINIHLRNESTNEKQSEAIKFKDCQYMQYPALNKFDSYKKKILIETKQNEQNFNQKFQEELVQKQILLKTAPNIQNLRSQNQINIHLRNESTNEEQSEAIKFKDCQYMQYPAIISSFYFYKNNLIKKDLTCRQCHKYIEFQSKYKCLECDYIVCANCDFLQYHQHAKVKVPYPCSSSYVINLTQDVNKVFRNEKKK